ncbi:hypothetical protein [Roseivirga sp.]|uniref:hypothetical protein n=1 Tax=Roseivirga sp. TaxID=1964215 RepID=UPI002B273569|nr:hypothetical protein [Roseivirga sp.]
MRYRDIRKYIDLLNKGNIEEVIFLRPISENVDLAKVWHRQSRKTGGVVCSLDFFFIKNEDEIYIGAILDMCDDLHWYIVPKQRKKGYLTRALTNEVLPYIFLNGRESQRITVSPGLGRLAYLNSKSVATKVGFKSIDKEESVFLLEERDESFQDKTIQERNMGLSKDRCEILKRRVNDLSKELHKISDELKMAYGDDSCLKEISKEVYSYVHIIEDLEWKNDKNRVD